MPKGSTPTARLEQRMTTLKSKLDKGSQNYSLLTAMRRQFNDMIGKETQVTMTKKRYDMEKKLEKMEKSLRRNVIRRGSDMKTP